MPKRKSKKVPKADTARMEADSRAARIGMFIVQHPRESVGLLMATIATGWIFANALFLQKGPHPAPIFAPPKQMAVPIAPVKPMVGGRNSHWPGPIGSGWPPNVLTSPPHDDRV